jgi:hypothetical protein
LDDAEGWEAGTGPTKIGTITCGGMRGIDDADAAAEDDSTREVSLVVCGDVEIRGVDVACVAIGKFAGSEDRSGAVEAACCDANTCSTLTVDSDVDPNTS